MHLATDFCFDTPAASGGGILASPRPAPILFLPSFSEYCGVLRVPGGDDARALVNVGRHGAMGLQLSIAKLPPVNLVGLVGGGAPRHRAALYLVGASWSPATTSTVFSITAPVTLMPVLTTAPPMLIAAPAAAPATETTAQPARPRLSMRPVARRARERTEEVDTAELSLRADRAGVSENDKRLAAKAASGAVDAAAPALRASAATAARRA